MRLESNIRLQKITGFDPARKLSNAELDVEVNALKENPVINALLDEIGTNVTILNKELQILFSNFRDKILEEPFSRRLGEAFGCVNSIIQKDGCGSSADCAYCSILNIVLSALEQNRAVSGECLILTQKADGVGSGEYLVTAKPIKVADSIYILVIFNDISEKKRRELLERLFIHDIRNALTGLIGWSDLLAHNPTDDTEATASRISAIAQNIAEEIENHRLLAAAETKQLKVSFQNIAIEDIILPLKFLFARHEVAYSKNIKFPDTVLDRTVKTDPAVLRRVLVNMVINALEATPKNGTVRVDCVSVENGIVFSVWNEAVIPKEVAAHIFKRSFSTKAETGRGLGTYSMKLFGEDILKGKVSFVSEKGRGTTFSIHVFT